MPGSPQARRLCVLIADASCDAADALGALCESAGHDVDFAYSLAAALEAARQLRPDVIFVDATLAEAARQLAADPAFAGTLIAGFAKPLGAERVLQLLEQCAQRL